MFNISENMKFFVMILVYVVYMTWWASGINSSVGFNTSAISKAVVTLETHVQECEKRDKQITDLTYQVKSLNKTISRLNNNIEK